MRLLVVLVSALLVALLVASSPAFAQTAESHFKRGVAFYQGGRLQGRPRRLQACLRALRHAQ